MKKLIIYSCLTMEDLHEDSIIVRLDKITFYDESKGAEVIYKRDLAEQPRGSIIFVTDKYHEKFFKIIY